MQKRTLAVGLTIGMIVVAILLRVHTSTAEAVPPIVGEALHVECRDGRSSVVLVLAAGTLTAAPWPSGLSTWLHRAAVSAVGELLARIGILEWITGSDVAPVRALKAYLIAGRAGLFRGCMGHDFSGPWGLAEVDLAYIRFLESGAGVERIALTAWGPIYRVWRGGYVPLE